MFEIESTGFYNIMNIFTSDILLKRSPKEISKREIHAERQACQAQGHLAAGPTYFWVDNPFFLKYFLSLF